MTIYVGTLGSLGATAPISTRIKCTKIWGVISPSMLKILLCTQRLFWPEKMHSANDPAPNAPVAVDLVSFSQEVF